MQAEAGVYRSSKTFRGYPCAHRKWRHPGHCAWVHGYSRQFEVWFGCDQRDENGFVMDFGDLKPVRQWLAEQFDHKLLIDADDPLLERFQDLEKAGGCSLNVLPDVGVEGTARFVFDWLDPWVRNRTGGRVRVVSVECRENENNSAVYMAPLQD